MTQRLIALTNPLFEEDLYERPNRNVSNRKKNPYILAKCMQPGENKTQDQR